MSSVLTRRRRMTLQLPGADAILLDVMATKLGKSREQIVGDSLRLLFEAAAGTVNVTRGEP